MRRRRYLALLGTTTVGGLAGCTGNNGGGDAVTSTETATSTPVPTETTGGESTTTATRTPTGTETATPTRTEAETTAETPTESTTTGSDAETTGESSNGTTTKGTEGNGASRTVEVGPGGQYVFEPGTQSPLEIPVGTTVEWVWRSATHNIVVGDQPSKSSWEGTPGDAGSVYSTGYTYAHTFETEGEYHYWCSPHQSLGMVADIVVTGGR